MPRAAAAARSAASTAVETEAGSPWAAGAGLVHLRPRIAMFPNPTSLIKLCVPSLFVATAPSLSFASSFSLSRVSLVDMADMRSRLSSAIF